MEHEITYKGNLLEYDPVYTAGFNAGLEYSAKWIRNSAKGAPEEVHEFAELNAQSIEIGKRELEQQDFFDAIRNNPYMYDQLKQDRDDLLMAIKLLLGDIDFTNGACRPNEMICAVLNPITLERAKEIIDKKRENYS